jgi:glycosyltransferase involved in cell wall biosynthesis
VLKVAIHVAGFFPESFGGGQEYSRLLAHELTRRGYEAVVITPAPGLTNGAQLPLHERSFERISVVEYRLDRAGLTPVERQGGLGSRSIAIARATLEHVRPDIVHLDDTNPAMAVAARELLVPSVVVAHHVGIACPVGDLLRPNGAVCAERMGASPCVACCCARRTDNGLSGRILGSLPRWIGRPVGRFVDRAEPSSPALRGLMFPWAIERRIEAYALRLHLAQLIVSPSNAIRMLLIRNGVTPDRIRLEPHGIEPLTRTPIPPFAGRSVRFGYVGRIARDKGLHVVFEALQRLEANARCRFLIAGKAQTNGDQQYLNDLVQSYDGPAGIEVLGYSPPDELSALFSRFDVVIVPSLVPEAFGLVVAEAFSAGRPVIVSDSGALPELVRDGVDGFVVARGDSEALAKKMLEFIEHPDLITRMSDSAPAVRTIGDYAGAMEQLYSGLLAAEPAQRLGERKHGAEA